MCISFDAWLVGFGLSRTVARLELLPAYQLLVLAIIIDALLLRSFFRSRHSAPRCLRNSRARDT